MEKVPCGEAHRYQHAFVSYASQDRPEVLQKVQMLQAVGIKFFQDILSLEPGDQWLSIIFKQIDESDVFLLFWSSNAKKSEWVRKEWQYALKREEKEFIRPVIIEGPPFPEPPAELAHIHFADKIRFFVQSN